MRERCTYYPESPVIAVPSPLPPTPRQLSKAVIFLFMPCSLCNENGHNARTCSNKRTQRKCLIKRMGNATETKDKTKCINKKTIQKGSKATKAIKKGMQREEEANKTTMIHKNMSDEEEDEDDSYGTDPKVQHRTEFAAMCKAMQSKKTNVQQHILYLDTEYGGATRELLSRGFEARHLHPCHYDDSVLDQIRDRFPGVSAERGDILDVHLTRKWLGVWFDMEETWCQRRGEQQWKLEHVPDFDRSSVYAISLSTRAMKGGPDAFAGELQNLITSSGGKIDQGVRAYKGKKDKNGVRKRNMVFGMGTFETKWMPKHYLSQRVHIPADVFGDFNGKETYMHTEDGKLVGTVAKVENGKFHIRYMSEDGNFFEDEDEEDPLTFQQVQGWMVRPL